jgi:hypothetical protein
MFNVQCSTFDVRCSTFDVRHSMFDVHVQCSTFNVRCSFFSGVHFFQSIPGKNNLALMGLRPALFRHSWLDQSLPRTRSGESMFIGTRRRKGRRKETKCLRRPSADQHGPRVRHSGPGSSPGWRIRDRGDGRGGGTRTP